VVLHVGVVHLHDVRVARAADAARLGQPLAHRRAAAPAGARISFSATSRSRRWSKASQTTACAPSLSTPRSAKRPKVASASAPGALAGGASVADSMGVPIEARRRLWRWFDKPALATTLDGLLRLIRALRAEPAWAALGRRTPGNFYGAVGSSDQ
jgi:hypothetical protein